MIDLAGHTIVPGFRRRPRARRRGHRCARRCRRGGARRGAAAEVRRHRVLPDLDRLRAGSVGGVARRPSTRARGSRAPRIGARAARASREQLHQSGVQRRAADGLLAHPRAQGARGAHGAHVQVHRAHSAETTFLRVIATHRASVGIVTLAPELPGGIDLVRDLVKHGHRVSLGHTGATYDEARAAIDAGARHATHLFNRMSSMTLARAGRGRRGARIECGDRRDHLRRPSRPPGAGVDGDSRQVAARMIAITDGTAAAGLPDRVTDAARRSDDHRRRPHGVARRRHAGRQHPDAWMARSGCWSTGWAGRCPKWRACARRRRRKHWACAITGAIAPGKVADLVVFDGPSAILPCGATEPDLGSEVRSSDLLVGS